MGKKSGAKRVSKQKTAVSAYCRERLKEGGFLLLMAIGCLLLVSLFSYHRTDPSWSYATSSTHVLNAMGRVGAYVSDVLLYLLGYSAYALPPLICYGAWISFRDRHVETTLKASAIRVFRFIGFLVLLLSVSGFIAIHSDVRGDLPFQSGGVLGVSVAGAMAQWFNPIGASIWLFVFAMFGLSAMTGRSIFRSFEQTGSAVIAFLSWVKELFLQVPWASFWAAIQCAIRNRMAEYRDKKEAQREPEFTQNKKTVPNKSEVPVSHSKQAGAVSSPEKTAVFQRADQVASFAPKTANASPGKASPKPTRRKGSASLPSLDLLDQNKVVKHEGRDTATLNAQAAEVEQRLADFGVKAEVSGIYPGPVVTRFEIQLSAGTKVSKVSNLSKDLARSLSVMSVRVVEVIPGKTAIGLELPNADREMVMLHDVLSSSEFKNNQSALPLALGKDIAGSAVVVDLAKMPHLLVAGTTGAGKSVGLNAMLLSLLYQLPPAELRFIMIDPKMLELSVYEGVPHLLTPVVTDMKDASKALRWCVAEMERRYQLMATLGVRNLAGYNSKVKAAISRGEPLLDSTFTAERGPARPLESLPKIVVLADEFADMMVVVGKKVETLISRLAQKARAAGIHLILATQRPSVDVITGLIKANIPTRIAFQVSSKVDSRTILDQQGAEQLLGYGDMLYLAPGSGVPVRVHGCYVSDDEVHRVASYLRNSFDLSYDESIMEETGSLQQDGGWAADGDSEKDEFYDEAVALVAKTRRVSVSSVQRRFKIGYNRASRIVEAMEAARVVSEMAQNGSREVLIQPLEGS